MSRKNSFITVTDQFCGAGGSSWGAARLGAEVRLALNTWPDGWSGMEINADVPIDALIVSDTGDILKQALLVR